MSELVLPLDYGAWLAELKRRIHGARQRAVLAANAEQIRLYHHIGCEILERQRRQGWGARVVDHLSADLRAAFPEMKGLSASNLKYMRVFAQECPDLLIGQRCVDQLPWGQILTLLTKLSDPALRAWYANEALEHAWSRDTLALQIKSALHLRQGAAVTNFAERLAPADARMAAQILKDPYHFDFLGLGPEAHERDIEGALVRAASPAAHPSARALPKRVRFHSLAEVDAAPVFRYAQLSPGSATEADLIVVQSCLGVVDDFITVPFFYLHAIVRELNGVLFRLDGLHHDCVVLSRLPP